MIDRFWSVIDTASGQVRRLGIFGELGPASVVPDILAELGPGPMELTLDCPGGDALAAMRLHDAIKGRCRLATITGQAHSAALLLAMAADRIEAYRSASIMDHSSHTFAFGDASHLRTVADEIERLNVAILRIMAARTRIDIDVLRSWFSGDGRLFTAEAALDVGLIDAIIEPPQFQPAARAAIQPACSPETPNERLFYDVLQAFGKIEVHNRKNFVEKIVGWLAVNVTTHE